LLADHERLILNHTTQYEELLRILRTQSEDSITQFTSDGEYKLTALIKDIEENLDGISNATIEKMDRLFNGDNFARFNDNVKFMNQKFDSSFKEIKSEIAKSNEEYEKAHSKLLEEKRKGWFARLKG